MKMEKIKKIAMFGTKVPVNCGSLTVNQIKN